METKELQNKRVLTPEQALDTEPLLPHSKLWGIPINKKRMPIDKIKIHKHENKLAGGRDNKE